MCFPNSGSSVPLYIDSVPVKTITLFPPQKSNIRINEIKVWQSFKTTHQNKEQGIFPLFGAFFARILNKIADCFHNQAKKEVHISHLTCFNIKVVS